MQKGSICIFIKLDIKQNVWRIRKVFRNFQSSLHDILHLKSLRLYVKAPIIVDPNAPLGIYDWYCIPHPRQSSVLNISAHTKKKGLCI